MFWSEQGLKIPFERKQSAHPGPQRFALISESRQAGLFCMSMPGRFAVCSCLLEISLRRTTDSDAADNRRQDPHQVNDSVLANVKLCGMLTLMNVCTIRAFIRKLMFRDRLTIWIVGRAFDGKCCISITKSVSIRMSGYWQPAFKQSLKSKKISCRPTSADCNSTFWASNFWNAWNKIWRAQGSTVSWPRRSQATGVARWQKCLMCSRAPVGTHGTLALSLALDHAANYPKHLCSIIFERML